MHYQYFASRIFELAAYVLTREIKYNPPHAKITIGVHTAGPGGSRACSPSCWKPPDTSQNARLTATAEHSAMTVLLRPNEMAKGIPIKAITITPNGDAYFLCIATARAAVSAPRSFKLLM